MFIAENSLIRDYRILNKLGEGGMGTVWLAEDTMLDRKVALKVLNPLLTTDSQFTERFRQEAKAQSKLTHSNIVSLYTFFEESGIYCMVIEYAEGITLKQLIKKVGLLPENRALNIFSQILDGVSYAHKKGIVHRDIKPGNIIVSANDDVKIMDFGIAKILGDKGMTKTGTRMGTIYYMSPEQIRGEKNIDSKSDIYSLGITFYEMVTGRVPFNTEIDSDFYIMKEIIETKIKDPREYYPHISEKSVEMIYCMTAKEKEKRPASCEDCRNLLNNNNNLGEIEDSAEDENDFYNDENELLEEDDELAYQCSSCSKIVDENATTCPNCGDSFSEYGGNNLEKENNVSSGNLVFWIIFLIISILILLQDIIPLIIEKLLNPN